MQASVLLVFYLVVFHALCNIPLGSAMHLGVLKRFWMQPQVVTCLFVGPGLRWVLRGLGVWDQRLVGTVVVGLIAWQVGAHYRLRCLICLLGPPVPYMSARSACALYVC